MRLLFAIWLGLWLVAPQVAEAGAWLREKGSGFTALTFGMNKDEENSPSLYFEYGLTEKTTVGFDIHAAMNGASLRDASGMIFLRRTLWHLNGPHKLSYELGLGGTYRDDLLLPTVKTGVSWGRGFQLWERNGWINVNAAYIYEPMQGSSLSKLEGTVGLDLGKITTGMIEIAMSRMDGDTFSSIEPSVLIKPKKGKYKFRVGVAVPFDNADKSSLKLGIWHSF
ncbi:MAG: hypothetical protein AB8B60_18635 [Sulfitobacter sp.]